MCPCLPQFSPSASHLGTSALGHLSGLENHLFCAHQRPHSLSPPRSKKSVDHMKSLFPGKETSARRIQNASITLQSPVSAPAVLCHPPPVLFCPGLPHQPRFVMLLVPRPTLGPLFPGLKITAASCFYGVIPALGSHCTLTHLADKRPRSQSGPSGPEDLKGELLLSPFPSTACCPYQFPGICPKPRSSCWASLLPEHLSPLLKALGAKSHPTWTVISHSILSLHSTATRPLFSISWANILPNCNLES